MKCFSEGHAGLATFAILVLIVCTLLIIALVVVVLGKVKVSNVNGPPGGNCLYTVLFYRLSKVVDEFTYGLSH